MKNILTILSLFCVSLTFAQLPITLKYFKSKHIDDDKIEVIFHTLSESNVLIYKIYDGDKLIMELSPKNTADNVYNFIYNPAHSNGVLKLISIDFDGVSSVYFTKYNISKNSKFLKFTYDGKYVGEVILNNFEMGFIYISDNGEIIKK